MAPIQVKQLNKAGGITYPVIMRHSYSLGSLLSVGQIMECADVLRKTNHDTVWIPETWGMECFSMLGAVSQRVHSRIGSSIINVYSRSPALVGMGAATIDALSGGRMVLGLGTSSRQIVEGLHGQTFARPVERMREYIGIIRKVVSGGKIECDGEFFKLAGFALLTKPARKSIPIYLAAVNYKMIELAWEAADGVILYLRPPGEMADTIRKMQSKRKIDAACQIITAVSHDSEKAMNRARQTLAFYVSVGAIYREFLARNGFGAETRNILGGYEESGIPSAARQVPDSMVDALTVAGTPGECTRKMARFTDAGVDHPIVQFNPVGDVAESFRLLVSTFSGADT